jgi:NSS family neurotransmitter:Na+ symporter
VNSAGNSPEGQSNVQKLAEKVMRPAGARRRSLWGTRFGFYLAAVGSAFGLGNLWRFPYITVENGGGAFVIMYIVMALCVGLPLLIGELMLGKISRRSVISACSRLSKDESISRKMRTKGGGAWMWTGRLSVIVCLLILSYYAVISGWVLHFLMQFFVSQLKTGAFDVEKSLAVLREHGGLQIALMSVHLLITLVIVGKGVQEGIEKWVSYSMPAFIILLMILVTKSLSLPSAGDALRFMFYPDFSKLTLFSPLDAIGHVLFTLSIGIGTMVTFGSYLNETTKIPAAGFRITAMDTVISLFAGLLIFPLLIGAAFSTTGPELLFQTLPRLLVDLDSGFLFGMAFFICLYLAALGASRRHVTFACSSGLGGRGLCLSSRSWSRALDIRFKEREPSWAWTARSSRRTSHQWPLADFGSRTRFFDDA